MSELDDLRARLARLEDARAVEAAKAAYCEALDSGYDLDALDRVLVDDACWTADGFGEHRGRAAIRGFFAELSGGVVNVRHYATAPRIAIEGDAAHAIWNMLCVCTRAHRDDPGREIPILEIGTYRDRLVRTGDGWRFVEITVEVAFRGSNLTRVDFLPNGR